MKRFINLLLLVYHARIIVSINFHAIGYAMKSKIFFVFLTNCYKKESPSRYDKYTRKKKKKKFFFNESEWTNYSNPSPDQRDKKNEKPRPRTSSGKSASYRDFERFRSRDVAESPFPVHGATRKMEREGGEGGKGSIIGPFVRQMRSLV